MKDRIQQFIDYKGITPGDLSTALDVQRSNISHILNGRNKPGAAFIEKFLLVYPDLNARWLLTGQGTMINENSSLKVDNSKQHSNIPSSDSVKNSNKTKASSALENNTSVGDSKSKPTQENTNNEGIEKLVLLNSDGTFIIYDKQAK